MNVLYPQVNHKRRAYTQARQQYTKETLGRGKKIKPRMHVKLEIGQNYIKTYILESKTRHSRTENMAVARLDIFQYILTTIYIDTQVQEILIAEGIDSVTKLISTNHNT